MPLEIYPLKSPVLKKNFNLLKTMESVLSKAGLHLKNNDILILSSKIVALSQGQIVYFKKGKKDPRVIELILREADKVFPGKMLLTLKDNILIPSAGIDFSNAPKGFAILWPKNPWKEAQNLRAALKKKFKLKRLGVVIIDSHCQPLRWGTTGIALSWAGFEGVEDCRGEKDIFGKPLKVTKKAVADNLASAAAIVMGEAAERVPFVLIRNAPVKFTRQQQNSRNFFIKPNECLFGEIYDKKLFF
ncbi:coenzyme F420-0:L-glutamate ligase [Candidatus Peregrinibacteria bacterium]|nr:coenzyme F420-0:L-glutamate ligase [Candidatus Peregrinibacteria bacterium]